MDQKQTETYTASDEELTCPAQTLPCEQSPCFPPRASDGAEHAKTLLKVPNASTALAPDLDDALRFLRALDPAGIFTFQTFLDADVFRDAEVGIQSAAERPRVLHGSLDDHAEQLTALNMQGAGIFVMVNAGDGVVKADANTCRTKANVQRVRSVFVDLDGAPIAPVLESALPPDWVVRSSPGRWHAYWRVVDCPLDRFESAQTALAARFNGDTKVKDLPRVMRIPGFLHQKAEPFRSELWEPASYREVLEKSHE